MGLENISKEEILKKIEASHQARVSGSTLNNFALGNVEFKEVVPEQTLPRETEMLEEAELMETVQTENIGGGVDTIDNYAMLMEKMRHVYTGSGCSSWNSHDHCGNWNNYDNCTCYPKQPDCSFDYTCTSWGNDCGCSTDLRNQLNRIETMLREIYMTNQQLYNCIIEYYNKFIVCKTTC